MKSSLQTYEFSIHGVVQRGGRQRQVFLHVHIHVMLSFSGGVMIYFDRIEVVNFLVPSAGMEHFRFKIYMLPEPSVVLL